MQHIPQHIGNSSWVKDSTSRPLTSPSSSLLAGQHSSRAKILGSNACGGITIQTRHTYCCTHINHHQSHFLPILADQLQTNATKKYSKNMGSTHEAENRKPRFLCLHGFRTSGEILKKQIALKWPSSSVVEKLDLVFIDAPFPCQGKSDVEGIFDPPYYEWFQFNKEFKEYENFEECLAYIEDCMIKYGPFDGLLGFSQGAILSAALPGLQEQGVALTRVPKIKYLIIIGGAPLKNPALAEKAYSSKIKCPSVHFLGETDFMKNYGIELLESFVDPVVIHHPKGHTIPRFDEKSLVIMQKFLQRIEREVNEVEEQEICQELDVS